MKCNFTFFQNAQGDCLSERECVCVCMCVCVLVCVCWCVEMAGFCAFLSVCVW
jgi:hypothetical protein